MWRWQAAVWNPCTRRLDAAVRRRRCSTQRVPSDDDDAQLVRGRVEGEGASEDGGWEGRGGEGEEGWDGGGACVHTMHTWFLYSSPQGTRRKTCCSKQSNTDRPDPLPFHGDGKIRQMDFTHPSVDRYKHQHVCCAATPTAPHRGARRRDVVSRGCRRCPRIKLHLPGRQLCRGVQPPRREPVHNLRNTMPYRRDRCRKRRRQHGRRRCAQS